MICSTDSYSDASSIPQDVNNCTVLTERSTLFLLQIREAGYNTQECPEAEASAGEVAGWGRALEPERPAESDGVCRRRTVQKTEAAHKFHATGHRGSQLLLWEKRPAHGSGDYWDSTGAELWQGSRASVVLQPATDAEKHEQDQRLPGSVADWVWRISWTGMLTTTTRT